MSIFIIAVLVTILTALEELTDEIKKYIVRKTAKKAKKFMLQRNEHRRKISNHII